MEHLSRDRRSDLSFESFSKLEGDRAYLFAIDDRRLLLHDGGPLPVTCTFPPSVWGEPGTTPCDACINDHAARLARAYGAYLRADVEADPCTREEAPMDGT